jgi:hypothetical protein
MNTSFSFHCIIFYTFITSKTVSVNYIVFYLSFRLKYFGNYSRILKYVLVPEDLRFWSSNHINTVVSLL